MNAHCFNHRRLAAAFAAAFFSLSALEGERAGVRCWRPIIGDPEFKALEKEIKIAWLK